MGLVRGEGRMGWGIFIGEGTGNGKRVGYQFCNDIVDVCSVEEVFWDCVGRHLSSSFFSLLLVGALAR